MISTNKPRRLLSRRRFLASSAATCAGATGLYAWLIEPHWLEVVHWNMPVANLPDELVGARLVQLSDLHIGLRVDDDYLVGVCEVVRDLAPEIVVYTGDFVTFDTGVERHFARVFPQLACGSLGTFGILGNHDYGEAWEDANLADVVLSLASDAGIRVLRNEVVNVHGLNIVGLDELWAGRFNPRAVLPSLAPDAPTVAMVHNPDAADCAGWQPHAGWILAGHTHGGQCKPPFLSPPRLPVRNRRYTCGEFALSGNRRMYISRGIGHSMQVRFNVRPEVTVFELERAV